MRGRWDLCDVSGTGVAAVLKGVVGCVQLLYLSVT